jgi:hypothetical protein
MLDQARTRSDIEWILGDLVSVDWDQEFNLVVMTGHAFQVLVEDDEIRASLTAIRSALTEEGHFAFDTRNPLVREWGGVDPGQCGGSCGHRRRRGADGARGGHAG